MSEDKGQLATKSLIDQFDLKELPQGIKYIIETTERRLVKTKVDDGDIENTFTTVRQGFAMANKPIPPNFTQQAVHDFYTTEYRKQ